MDFPVQNIIQNVRHFIDAVKKEMGNTADGKGDLGLKGRNACMLNSHFSLTPIDAVFIIQSPTCGGSFSAHSRVLGSQFLTSNAWLHPKFTMAPRIQLGFYLASFQYLLQVTSAT